MGLSLATLALAKKYTRDSLIGRGALKGAPCKIKDIVSSDVANTVTFEWKGTDDSTQTSVMTVEHGISIVNVEVNQQTNELMITLSNNSVINGGKITTLKGDKGDPGFSPIIIENADNTEDIYKLDITTIDGTITTPNLMKGSSVQVTEFAEAAKNIFKVVSTTSARLNQLSVEFGQLIFVKDTKQLYFDHQEGRTLYSQIIILETEAERLNLRNPLNSFYFVKDTGIIWRYDTTWIALTNPPSEQIEFLPKTQFPTVGKPNVLYIDGVKMYRWIADEYVEMGVPIWGTIS